MTSPQDKPRMIYVSTIELLEYVFQIAHVDASRFKPRDKPVLFIEYKVFEELKAENLSQVSTIQNLTNENEKLRQSNNWQTLLKQINELKAENKKLLAERNDLESKINELSWQLAVAKGERK